MLKRSTLYFLLFFLVFSPTLTRGQVDYLEGHDVQKGEELFKANCTSCHKLGDEKKARLIGPGLNLEIFEEYTEEWLISWIKNSSAMIESGDEQAIAIFEEYNQSVMTAFPTLSDDDVRDILAYIENPPVVEVEEILVVESSDSESSDVSLNNLVVIIIGLLAFLMFITCYEFP